MKKKKVAFFSNIAPYYRKPLWTNLVESQEMLLKIYYGKGNKRIKTLDGSQDSLISNHQSQFICVKNIYAFQKVLFWQSKVIWAAISKKWDTLIFTGEMYCVSTWIASIIGRLKGCQVIFWTHGLYGDESKLKLYFRMLFYSISHHLFVYENRAKNLLISQGKKSKSISVIYNSLNHAEQLQLRKTVKSLDKEKVMTFFHKPNLKTLVFIGRLTKAKKLHMLIKCVDEINAKGLIANLLIIGDGEDLQNLTELATTGIENRYIKFFGPCYAENKIATYLYHSDLCISPGNVGLTAIHSLGYGTPVATHDNMNNQGPEAEVIVEGVNGFLFEEDNLKDLFEKTTKWLSLDRDREDIRMKCYERIDTYYNADYQLKIINREINSHE